VSPFSSPLPFQRHPSLLFSFFCCSFSHHHTLTSFTLPLPSREVYHGLTLLTAKVGLAVTRSSVVSFLLLLHNAVNSPSHPVTAISSLLSVAISHSRTPFLLAGPIDVLQLLCFLNTTVITAAEIFRSDLIMHTSTLLVSTPESGSWGRDPHPRKRGPPLAGPDSGADRGICA